MKAKPKYKIGDYIKCDISNSGTHWYHTNPMKIINVDLDIDTDHLDPLYYVEAGSFHNNTDDISESMAYQDKECIRLSNPRKQKLKRILSLIPEEYKITYLTDESEIIEANYYKNKKGFFIFYFNKNKIFSINNTLIKSIRMNEK